jgi:hypothetical protein
MALAPPPLPDLRLGLAGECVLLVPGCFPLLPNNCRLIVIPAFIFLFRQKIL